MVRVSVWPSYGPDALLLVTVNADGTGELDEEAAPMKAVPTYSEHRQNFQDIERVGAFPILFGVLYLTLSRNSC